MKGILVTGGSGFVGANLAIHLKQKFRDADITAFDNLKRRGSEFNVERLRTAGIHFVHGDVRNSEDFSDLKPADFLIECSAEPAVLSGYDGTSPEYVFQTNLRGTFHCLEWARKHGAKVLFLSTSRVYPIERLNNAAFVEEESRFSWTKDQTQTGISKRGVSEELSLQGARSLYGMTKLASEMLLEEYAFAYGTEYVVNRCGLVAGPWQMGKSDNGVITFWVLQHLFGDSLSYIGYGGSGKQVRDFLHIDDLSELIIEQIGNFELYSGETFNVGGGTEFSVSLRELTALCVEKTKRSLSIQSIPETRIADIRIYVSDCSKLFSKSRWRPTRNAEHVVEDIKRWATDNSEKIRKNFY